HSSAGEHLWSKRLGGTSGDFGTSVASDPAGGVLLAGWTWSPSIELGGGALPSWGLDDIVLAKYSSAGEHLWSKRLGGTGNDFTYSVASDPAGGVLLAGFTSSSSIDLGGGALHYRGSIDIVLARYVEDATPPASTLDPNEVITTSPGPVGAVTGAATDDLAGVASVTVTFVSQSSGKATSVSAGLSCNANRRSCRFRAQPPPTTIPGYYIVTAQATDRARNTESPGPSMTVLVL
ncbi:MAG: SBBP repeat-containing protein, partial [Acidobacteria bacterium]|nr:SBBP repeat-containing protein [Acidobacteriota bacterium]